jgi:hypothetical protein
MNTKQNPQTQLSCGRQYPAVYVWISFHYGDAAWSAMEMHTNEPELCSARTSSDAHMISSRTCPRRARLRVNSRGVSAQLHAHRIVHLGGAAQYLSGNLAGGTRTLWMASSGRAQCPRAWGGDDVHPERKERYAEDTPEVSLASVVHYAARRLGIGWRNEGEPRTAGTKCRE